MWHRDLIEILHFKRNSYIFKAASNIKNCYFLFDKLCKWLQRCDIISTRNNQLDSSVSVHLLRNQTCDSSITLIFFLQISLYTTAIYRSRPRFAWARGKTTTTNYIVQHICSFRVFWPFLSTSLDRIQKTFIKSSIKFIGF